MELRKKMKREIKKKGDQSYRIIKSNNNVIPFNTPQFPSMAGTCGLSLNNY